MLDFQHVTVKYGSITAVRGLSLRVADGGFVALVGRNGAGKTTTLRAISGLLQPADGTIAFDGKRIDGLRPYDIAARGIAHVPEGRGVLGTLTVAENLHLGAFQRRLRAREMRNDLDQVFEYFPQLKNRLRQKAGSLSGGEQQMLVTGRALMSKARLLLLDEPSLGLAPGTVEELYECLAAVNKQQGVAVVLVEQYVDVALKAAEYVYVLEKATCVLEGPTDELAEDPALVAAYIG